MGWSCTRVMREGSTTGLGRRSVSRMFCHCGGRPTNLPSLGSKEVCTRCWKFCGAEISGRFFFFTGDCSVCWGPKLPSRAQPPCTSPGSPYRTSQASSSGEWASSPQSGPRSSKSPINKPTQTTNMEKRCLFSCLRQVPCQARRLWGCVFIRSKAHDKYHSTIKELKGGWGRGKKTGKLIV